MGHEISAANCPTFFVVLKNEVHEKKPARPYSLEIIYDLVGFFT
jgi:hypothetical protein